MDDMRPEFSFAVQENVFNLWYKFTTSKKEEMPTLLMFPPELQDMILEFLFQSGMKMDAYYVVHSVKATI